MHHRVLLKSLARQGRVIARRPDRMPGEIQSDRRIAPATPSPRAAPERNGSMIFSMKDSRGLGSAAKCRLRRSVDAAIAAWLQSSAARCEPLDRKAAPHARHTHSHRPRSAGRDVHQVRLRQVLFAGGTAAYIASAGLPAAERARHSDGDRRSRLSASPSWSASRPASRPSRWRPSC